MNRLGMSDSLKHRRTWVYPLTIAGPVGVTVLIAVEWLLRWEWLQQAAQESGAWPVLLQELAIIDVASMALGVALLSSMVFDVDHRSGGWKQIFALPISRAGTYIVKLGGVAGLILVASGLVGAGTVAIWLWLGFGPVPWGDIGLLVVLPWVAVLPLVAWQSALSAHLRNQAIALTVGVVGTVVTLFGQDLPAWLPWAMVTDAARHTVGEGIDVTRLLAMSAAWTVGLAALGAVSFARREVR